MKTTAFALALVLAAATSGLADQAPAGPAAPAPDPGALEPSAAEAPALEDPALEPLVFEPPAAEPAATCTVTIQCNSGGSVSCTSTTNSCATQGQCVVCNGQVQACCTPDPACVAACDADYDDCRDICDFVGEGFLCYRACLQQWVACRNQC